MATETTLAEHFADLAKYFRAKAINEKGPRKAEWEHLADCYRDLANNQVGDHDRAIAMGLSVSRDHQMENDSKA
jgi:hypothetical protein